MHGSCKTIIITSEGGGEGFNPTKQNSCNYYPNSVTSTLRIVLTHLAVAAQLVGEEGDGPDGAGKWLRTRNSNYRAENNK